MERSAMRGMAFPDLATLHPGYKVPTPSLVGRTAARRPLVVPAGLQADARHRAAAARAADAAGTVGGRGQDNVDPPVDKAEPRAGDKAETAVRGRTANRPRDRPRRLPRRPRAARLRGGNKAGFAETAPGPRRSAGNNARRADSSFRRDRIAGRLGVAGKLDVFFGDVGSGSADFHVGTVRLVDPGQGVLTLAVAPAHAFVLTVSHGSLVHHSLLRRSPASSRVSPAHTPASRGHLAAPGRRKPASSGLRAELDLCHDNRSNLFAATSPRCCQPLIPRATLNGARQTGDAASRIPSRRTLALRGLSASPRRSLEEPCSGPLWRRVTVVSGRFRGRTVVGLAR